MKSDTGKKYRKILIAALLVAAMVIEGLIWWGRFTNIPDDITLLVNREESFDFNMPFEARISEEGIGVIHVNQDKLDASEININLNEPFSIASDITGSYSLDVSLFGMFEVKKVALDVIDSIEVIPCGNPIGITVRTNGILVLGTSPVLSFGGENYEPAANLLKSGDYIIEVNGSYASDKDILINAVKNCAGGPLLLKVRRDGELFETEIKPVKSAAGDYKLGVWVRDDTQGIGTLTYITTTGEFGGLGHGIADIDTGLLMEIEEGNIYIAEIVSVVKGRIGEPGELAGIIFQNEGSRLGKIKENTNQGIFGSVIKTNDVTRKIFDAGDAQIMQIGLKQEIELGKASLLCSVEGEIKSYDINIEKVDLISNSHSKGLVIKITDERLIEKTGGIVQGMSGSPIVQNGKLIGAVTHVFVNDPTRGYGIFIEEMLDN